MRRCFYAALLFVSSNAVTQSPELVTDRPDQTESAVTVPNGHAQVEMGMLLGEADGERTLNVATTLIRVGVHPRLELRLGVDGWVKTYEDEESSGLGDGSVGLKLLLWGEDELRPQAALLAWTTLPIGASNVSTEHVDPGFRLSFSHTLSDRVGFGYNTGVVWETEVETGSRRIAATDSDTLATFQYTASLGITLTERWKYFIEVFGDIPLNASGGPAHSVDGGFTYLIHPNVQWDISGGAGLNDAADDWFVGTGISFRFPS